THAELLVYDWSNYGDIETVVEDIERVDFDCFGKYDPKMKDWRIFTTWEWNEARMKYTTDKNFLMNLLNIPRFDVPELLIDGHDAGKRFEVWNNAPGMKYAKGYNADMGDTGLLTKTKFFL
ncbi:unnamed protein product, partial [Timema podura]|nr:unnamed protein product [Timema podura]